MKSALVNFINIDLVLELARKEERWSATSKAWVSALVRAGFDLRERVASAGGGVGAAAEDDRVAGAGVQLRPAVPSTPMVRQSLSRRGLEVFSIFLI